MPTLPPNAGEQPAAPAGFSLPLDIVIAPGRAFLKIARTAEWIPALAIIAASGAATTALATPAMLHIATLETHGPLPTRTDVLALLGFELLGVPLLVALLIAMFVTVLARWKDPAAQYRRSFSLAVNCLIPSALGSLVHAAVAAARQPWAYSSFRAYQIALPDSLGVFARAGNQREFEFLSRFTLFDAWSFVLLGFGISLFVGMRFSTALLIAAGLYFFYVAAYG